MCLEEADIANGNKLQDAIAIGKKNAVDVLTMRTAARARRALALAAHPAKMAVGVTQAAAMAARAMARETAGFLVAMGDSWFDYPFYDVIKLLEDHYGYDVESAAHRGDPLESMAYARGQLYKLASCFEKVTERGGVPKAVLISGGGDDIAGNEFGMLINSKASGIAGWNNEVLDGVINDRILNAYRTTAEAVNGLSVRYAGKVIPILVHGYDQFPMAVASWAVGDRFPVRG